MSYLFHANLGHWVVHGLVGSASHCCAEGDWIETNSKLPGLLQPNQPLMAIVKRGGECALINTFEQQ